MYIRIRNYLKPSPTVHVCSFQQIYHSNKLLSPCSKAAEIDATLCRVYKCHMDPRMKEVGVCVC